jgi:predicted ATPase
VAALGLKNTVARLELLKLGHRSAVARHQTLKATIDWSYDLLSGVERIVFRRVAPFVDHFTLDGARYVADDLGFADGDFFDAIAGLVEKSLIATRLNEGQAEYRLLDTTRAYALKKLEEHAEFDVVLRRHAEYVAGCLESQRVALLAIECAEADKSSHVHPSGETPTRLKLVRMRCRGG